MIGRGASLEDASMAFKEYRKQPGFLDMTKK